MQDNPSAAAPCRVRKIFIRGLQHTRESVVRNELARLDQASTLGEIGDGCLEAAAGLQSLNIFAKQLHNFKDYSKREMRHAKAKFWPMANKGRLECGMKGLDDDEGFVEVDVDIGERMGEGGRGETSRKAEAQVQQQVKATTTKGGLEGEDATKISPAQ